MALSEDELRRTVSALESAGSKRAAARALGIARMTLDGRLVRAAELGLMGTKPVLPGYAIRRTSTQRDAAGNIEREWVQQSKAPGAAFEMPEGQVIKGVSALVDAEGRELFKWVKTKTDTLAPDWIAAIKAAFDGWKGRARPLPAPRRVDHDLLSVYPIADQHNGMLAWGRETGESYDLRIGADRLRASMARLVAQAPRSRRALILNLGDWQHTDDGRNMTPRSGNILDVDGRYVKVLTAGVQLMMDCIELALQRHSQVLVRNIPGNHDPHASVALTIALKSFYARNRRVKIDTDPSDFFFERFGSTLIGATHGHRLKPADMAMSMAVRRRADWGATKFHYFYFGHIHHETAKEIGDVRCESFQTLAAKDAHAAASGYNSGQSLTSITIHRRDGEIGRHRINIGRLS